MKHNITKRGENAKEKCGLSELLKPQGGNIVGLMKMN